MDVALARKQPSTRIKMKFRTSKHPPRATQTLVNCSSSSAELLYRSVMRVSARYMLHYLCARSTHTPVQTFIYVPKYLYMSVHTYRRLTMNTPYDHCCRKTCARLVGGRYIRTLLMYIRGKLDDRYEHTYMIDTHAHWSTPHITHTAPHSQHNRHARRFGNGAEFSARPSAS